MTDLEIHEFFGFRFYKIWQQQKIKVKTLVKINIVLILLSVVFLSANFINTNLAKENTHGKLFSGKEAGQVLYSFDINSADELEQTNNDFQTRKYISINNAPVTFGGFENYFSTQFTLPETRTIQRFTSELRI